jgi:4-amino-4-deoxy-L-arabinose transferase-like glycosyltransferase
MRPGLRWPPVVIQRPLVILFVIFIARLLLALVIVPPWQNGDEPQHVASVLILTRESAADGEAAVEADIIGSMAAYQFWEYYSRPVPAPLPSRFVETTIERRAIGDGQHYYEAAAALVRWVGPAHVTGQLYVVRGLSALLAILTLACCWAAARQAVGEHAALIATGFLALHPQFALVSTTATPDMVINLCGAFMWWQAIRLLEHPRSASAFVGLWAAAALGVTTRRLGFLLLPIAAVVSAAAVAQVMRSSGRHRWAAAALGLAMLGALGVLMASSPGGVSTAAAALRSAFEGQRAERRTLSYVLLFSRSLFDSAWLVAGWFRFPAPGIWLWVMHALTACAAVGTVRSLSRGGGFRGVQLTAVAFVGSMVAGVYAYHLALMNGGALGRYLFPAAGPMSVLLWLGLRTWWPERHWGMVAVALLALIAIFDAVGWAYLLMPTYVWTTVKALSSM